MQRLFAQQLLQQIQPQMQQRQMTQPQMYRKKLPIKQM
jgi:hypothetical protein